MSSQNLNKKCLKISVIEAKLSDKNEKKAPKQKTPRTIASSKAKGHFITLKLVDGKGQQSGSEFFFATKTSPNKGVASWNQTCLFTVPKDAIGTTFAALQIALIKTSGGKQKIVGQCMPIQLAALEEVGIQEKILSLGGKAGSSLKVNMGWYGTGARAQKAKEDLQFASLKIYTEQDVQEIAQKIMRYERELSQLEAEFQELQKGARPYERVLMKYRDVDDEARELVGGNQSTSSSNNAVISSLYAEFKADGSAHACAEFLAKNEQLDYLPEVKTKIFTSDTNWCKQFLAHGGMKTVVSLFTTRENQGYDRALGVRVAQLASIIKTLMNDQLVAEEIITKHGEDLKATVVATLHSKNPLVKAQMFAFFSALCLYGKSSHELVLSAILDVDAELQPFYTIVQVVRTERDREVITSAMMLINALIAGEKEIGMREKLRDYCTSNDMTAQMEHLREHFPDERSLIIQFNVYNTYAKADKEELRILRFVGGLDLCSEMSLFNNVIEQVEKLQRGDSLLRHLHHLLLLPHTTTNTQESWRFIELASRRAIAISEKEAQSPITISEVNKQLKAINQRQLEDKMARISSVLSLPKLPPGARTVANALIAGGGGPPPPPGGGPGGAPPPMPTAEDKSADIPHDPTVPEPQRKMKSLFWVPKNKEGDQDMPEWWDDAIPAFEDLGSMFQDLQERFFQPKSTIKKVQKVSLLPLPVANAITIWRAQFPHVDDEALVDDIFDISGSAGTILTYHYEGLLSTIPNESDLAALRAHQGSRTNLERADQFLLSLLAVPKLSEKLVNLIYWSEFDNNVALCDYTFKRMDEVCHKVLDNAGLKRVLEMVLSLGGYLKAGQSAPHPASISRLRSATMLRTANPLPNSMSASPGGAAGAGGPPSLTMGDANLNANRNGPVTDVELNNYLISFVSSNYNELQKYSDIIIDYELAFRYQPTIISKTLSRLRTGCGIIATQLSNDANTSISPRFQQYYDVMKGFTGVCKQEIERLEKLFEDKVDGAARILKQLGIQHSKDPFKDLWVIFHMFAKQFKSHVESLQTKHDEAARRKRLETRTSMPNLGYNTSDQECGTMDKLIASIRDGVVN